MTTATTEDWQLNKSVLESNKQMLENQLYCDVTFIFNRDKAENKQVECSISAHKYVLISRSPVFCAMFTGPAKDENSEVRIEDVEKEAFTEMLRYMYFEVANLTGENVLTVLYCAKKYLISGLENECREFLEKQIDHNNVCFILEQASLMGEPELEGKCLTLIDESAAETLNSEAFSQVSSKTIEKIVQRDTLVVEELQVFRACVKWAETECRRKQIEANDTNKRKILGDIIYMIRFPTMDPEEFIQSVSSTEILTHAEALNLILMMKGSKPREELSFTASERQSHWNEVLFQGCFIYYVNSHITQIPFVVQTSRKNISIASLLFLNANSFNKITLQSTQGTISKLEGRLHESHLQMYEVTFKPPVIMKSGERGVVHVGLATSPSRLTRLNGNPMISNQDVTISMQSTTWNFIVGFKYRITY